MPIRVGILSTAHLHVWSYLAALQNSPKATLVGVWDEDKQRLDEFCRATEADPVFELDKMLKACQAVVITSENSRHGELVQKAVQAGCCVLCEKPLAMSEGEAKKIERIAETAKVTLMTAFPCRFSPAYKRLKERVKAGEIGRIEAICATNRGRCPFGWFVEKDKSGGGAMIDHVVHVADLLRDLLGSEPKTVFAQTGNNMYEKDWEDTAMLTLEYPKGVFATLDSSWSRPLDYKTWGDVTMNVVGSKGVIEMNMFGQSIEYVSSKDSSFGLAGYGSNLDALMIDAFLDCVEDGSQPPVTFSDGLGSSRVALAGYRSVKEGRPVRYAD